MKQVKETRLEQINKDRLSYVESLLVGPSETLGIVRETFKIDGLAARDQVYGALRGATWILLVSRNYDSSEMRDWHDTLRQAAALFDDKRVRTLADMALKSARFGAMLDLREESPKYIEDILKAIRQSGGQTSFAEIKLLTKMEPTILLKILRNMTAEGLVRRQRGYGQKLTLSLR